MGPDLLADITLLLGLTVGAIAVLGRMLRGVESRLREDLKAQVASVREESTLGRAKLESRTAHCARNSVKSNGAWKRAWTVSVSVDALPR